MERMLRTITVLIFRRRTLFSLTLYAAQGTVVHVGGIKNPWKVLKGTCEEYIRGKIAPNFSQMNEYYGIYLYYAYCEK